MTATDLLAETQLPTPDEEIWRYSRIDQLDLAGFSLARHSPEVSFGDDADGCDIDTDSDVELIAARPDVFADLAAQVGVTTSISVPANVTVSTPIVLTHRIDPDGTLRSSRLMVEVADNAEVTVIERFVSNNLAVRDTDSSGDGASGVFLPVVQVLAHSGARVRYLAINELDDRIWSIGHQQSVGKNDSTVLLASVALGGYYARTRTEALQDGPGSSTRQVALYFAGDDQMHDFRTIQDHAAPHTSSDMLFKGAVQDRSRSVYTGLIKIRESAPGTTAYQTNRNLTLSEGAWAESVPNLDIQTNDVKCSHASTVGPIDADQRFYLESRGIDPDIAERLVVLGFFDEVLGQLPAGELAAELREAVAAKLQVGAQEPSR